MPLPCPLFDYWHRHATPIAVLAAFISAAITWVCIAGAPTTSMCATNFTQQPPHPAPIMINHCQTKQWIHMAEQLGFIEMNYQDKSSLELHGSFHQCMALTAWLEQHLAPLQRLSLKRSTLRQQQHQRIITCLFTFHCP